MTTTSRHDSTELATSGSSRPPASTPMDAPRLVASVFGQVQVERWDAPLVRLPDRDASATT
jgi:hypothetical protein